MKTSFKKSLSLVLAVCILFACIIIPNQAIKASAADYVETNFGEGKFLITTTFNGATYYLPATTTSSAPAAKKFTSVSEIPESHLWTVTANGSNYYIQNSEGKYLYTTSNNNGVRVGTTKNAWKYDSSNNSLQDTNTSRFLGIYNAQDWRCYTSVTASNYKESSTSFKFYKINEAAPLVTISGNTNDLLVGTTTTLTAELSNISGTVNWSSSNSDVATVANGVVTAKSMGKVTISATVNGIVGNYELSVYPELGELTIAEALKVCEITGTVNAPFEYSVLGVITSIDTAYSEDYNNITVTISDGTDSIKAYRMTGGSDLVVGDQIMVSGTLVNFMGNTPEFVAGCTFEKIENDNIDAIREKLNAVASKMSLAFKYEVATETVNVSSEVVDTLNRATTGATSTTYVDWSGKTDKSGAVYKGNSAGSNSSIQLRSNNSNSGIVTTASGGKAVKITVKWNSNTSDTRTIDIYGKNTAYSSASDLYNESTQGTKIGSIKKGTTELEISGDYAFIGIRSTTGALYLEEIQITWESANGSTGGTEQKEVYKNSEFAFRFAVDASLVNIADVDSYGIKVTAGENEVFYSTDAISWTIEGGYAFVTVELGDIINDKEKLSTEFTVAAYIEIDEIKYTSSQATTYSVADMVAYYVDTLGIEEIQHLYDFISNEHGLI